MIAKKETRPRGRPPKETTMEQIAIRLPKALLAMVDEHLAGRLDGKTAAT
jgi:hypothetical protein